MAAALVHFTVGFVAVLVVLAVVPITRYRLSGAYVGGVWALGPDIHRVISGALGARIHALHDSPHADLFFFHYTLDGAPFESYNNELTFVALGVLGFSFIIYEWRVSGQHQARRRDMTDGTDQASDRD